MTLLATRLFCLRSFGLGPVASAAMLLASAAMLLACAGCSGDFVVPDVVMVIVTPDGSDPTEGVDEVHIRVRQDGMEPLESSAPVVDGDFSVSVPTLGELALIEVSVELTGPSVRRVGAAVPFFPIESGGAVRIVVGEPGTCETVLVEPTQTTNAVALGAAREQFAFTRNGTFALVAGGVEASGESARATWIDLLQFRHGEFENLASPVGVAAGVPLDPQRAVVLAAGPFIYDLQSSTSPVREAGLHPGAGLRSAAVQLPASGSRPGAFIAGGGTREAPVAEGTFLSQEDAVATWVTLETARSEPAIALLGGEIILVAGGAAETAPVAELLPVGGTGSTSIAFMDGLRFGAELFIDATGDQALLIGGDDGAGVARRDTVWLHGCPACVAEPGPEWATARLGVASSARASGGGWLAGGEDDLGAPSPTVELIRFTTDGPPAIEPAGTLQVGRARASAISLPAGILLVGGGATASGLDGNIEACFPEALTI